MRRIRGSGSTSLEVRESAEIEIEAGADAEISIFPSGQMRIGIKAGRGSRVRCFTVCQSGARISQANRIMAGAHISSSSIWLAGADAKLENALEGKGARSDEMHLFVTGGRDKLRLDSTLRHSERDTKGDILIKGVVRDRASAILEGMIRIDKKGRGAESFLAEHAMLLGKGAHASASPELEIENNDVSSRHAASVSQIDEEKLFYLMSRGIRRREAKGLVVEGFLESALDRMEGDGWRERFLALARSAISAK